MCRADNVYLAELDRDALKVKWRTAVKYILVFLMGVFGVTTGYCQEGDAERSGKQAQLDSQCEEARQVALAPGKQDVFKECMDKKKNVPLCKIEADKYNGVIAGRAPLFYNLPECEAAFDYRNNL